MTCCMEMEGKKIILHENKEIKYQEKAWISKVLDRLQRSSGQTNGSPVCCISKAGQLTPATDSLIIVISTQCEDTGQEVSQKTSCQKRKKNLTMQE